MIQSSVGSLAMRWAVVTALVVCASAGAASGDSTADRKPWSFDLPSDLVEVQTPMEGMMVMLRTYSDVRAVDGHIYESSEGVRLVQLSWQSVQKSDVAWSDLESDAKGLLEKLTKRPNIDVVSSTSRRDGASLIVETDGVMDGRPFVLRQMFGVDAQHAIHAFMIMCGGAEVKVAKCTEAVQSMRLDIEKQVMPASKSSREKERDDAIFGLATIILLALGIGVFGLRQSGRGPAWLRRNL